MFLMSCLLPKETKAFQNEAELQIRRGIDDNSKIIFLICQ